MKKFIVKYKDSKKIFGEFASKEEASDKVMEFINDHYISPFDFELEEVEYKDVNEVITDFETARNVLGVKPNAEFTVVEERRSKNAIKIEDVRRLVNEINPKHIESLIVLNKLFTTADAWHKEDGFEPDFSDFYQDKWFPLFKYDKDAALLVYSYSDNLPTGAYAHLGSQICFKTKKRAEQFGEKFAHLYNKVFLSKTN